MSDHRAKPRQPRPSRSGPASSRIALVHRESPFPDGPPRVGRWISKSDASKILASDCAIPVEFYGIAARTRWGHVTHFSD